MKSQAGFTIVEILMVILLVGIISAVAVPNFIDFRSDAHQATTQQKLNELKMAIVGNPNVIANGKYVQPGYIAHLGSVPPNLDRLQSQGTLPAYDPFSKTGWRGPYITTTDPNWNRDGWGLPLQYSPSARTITSCGKDRSCGNADDIIVRF